VRPHLCSARVGGCAETGDKQNWRKKSNATDLWCGRGTTAGCLALAVFGGRISYGRCLARELKHARVKPGKEPTTWTQSQSPVRRFFFFSPRHSLITPVSVLRHPAIKEADVLELDSSTEVPPGGRGRRHDPEPVPSDDPSLRRVFTASRSTSGRCSTPTNLTRRHGCTGCWLLWYLLGSVMGHQHRGTMDHDEPRCARRHGCDVPLPCWPSGHQHHHRTDPGPAAPSAEIQVSSSAVGQGGHLL
jgi:hypothetical protein